MYNIFFISFNFYMLGTSCDIIQLACVAGEEMFNRYVFPNLAITPGATAVTGIYVKNGEMFVHNTRVQSVSVEKCMEELAEWLKQFHKPLLVCHNGRAFDSIILLKNCMKIPCSLPFEGFVCWLLTVCLFLKKLFQVGNVTNWKP